MGPTGPELLLPHYSEYRAPRRREPTGPEPCRSPWRPRAHRPDCPVHPCLSLTRAHGAGTRGTQVGPTRVPRVFGAAYWGPALARRIAFRTAAKTPKSNPETGKSTHDLSHWLKTAPHTK